MNSIRATAGRQVEQCARMQLRVGMQQLRCCFPNHTAVLPLSGLDASPVGLDCSAKGFFVT